MKKLSPAKGELCFYIIQIIQASPDPEKAGAVLMDIIQRIAAGEDMRSIEAQYGAELAEIKKRCNL